jgi:nucleoside-diphosphate-sugar epimerase
VRAFVTGGSGYLGGHLIGALVAQGHAVRALARSDDAAATVTGHGAKAVRGDLLNADAMAAGMKGCAVAYHCAALADDWGDLADFERINVNGTRAVLDAATIAGVRKLVHVSTEAVYLDREPLVQLTESRALPEHPLSGYPSTKGAAERLVLQANCAALATVIVRPRLIWGKDDPKILPRLVEASDGGWLRLIDGGRFLTSTCHVDNCVEGMMLAAERGDPGRVFFLTDGEPVEVRWFLTQVLAAVSRPAPTGTVPLWAATWIARICALLWRFLPLKGSPPITPMAVLLSGHECTVVDRRARSELGYKGRVSLAEGLAGLTGPPDLPPPPAG